MNAKRKLYSVFCQLMRTNRTEPERIFDRLDRTGPNQNSIEFDRFGSLSMFGCDIYIYHKGNLYFSPNLIFSFGVLCSKNMNVVAEKAT